MLNRGTEASYRVSNSFGDSVGGGGGNSGVVSTAELYNPATGQWTTTGSLNTAVEQQTATLLTNGDVLIAGGNTGGFPGSATTVAELYNPATGQWTTTGSLNIGVIQQTATLLNNGEVLLAGGGIPSMFGGATPSAVAELYNPATGTWSNTASLNTGVYEQTATLLNNGEVLVAGGVGNSGVSNVSELYNPAIAPTVTAISPTSGPAAGGTSVTITGFGFNAASGVMFGTTAAASFTVNSDTSITATSPAGSGTVDVSVTTALGTSTTSSADQFTFTVTPPPPPPPPAPTANQFIAVGADAGTSPQVVVYNAQTGAIVASFYAFSPSFTRRRARGGR